MDKTSPRQSPSSYAKRATSIYIRTRVNYARTSPAPPRPPQIKSRIHPPPPG